MYNTININPAYAGSRGSKYFALHPNGFLDGAPVTNAVSINTPLNNSSRLGVSIINDRIGPHSREHDFC
jgi:hypothetical protein